MRKRRLLENRNWRRDSFDLEVIDRLRRVICLPNSFLSQGVGQHDICCATDRRGEVLVILLRSARTIEREIEANHPGASLCEAFDELSVQVTRPVAWFGGKVESLSGLLVDRDNDDFWRRLRCAP